jgi:hypothetical protein
MISIQSREHCNGKQNIQSLSKIDLSKPWEGYALMDAAGRKKAMDANKTNRPIRTTHVTYLANSFKEDGHRPDHPSPIVFDKNGNMLDGQHRVSALQKLEMDAIVRVITGVDPNLYKYVDSGLSRTLSDRMKFVDDSTTNRNIAMIVVGITQLKLGNFTKSSAASAAHVFESWNPDAVIWAASKANSRLRGITRGSVLVAIAEMYSIYPEEAEIFWGSLREAGCRGINQAILLRDFLISNNNAGGQARKEVYERSVYAMNAYLEGSEIKVLRRGKWTIAKVGISE